MLTKRRLLVITMGAALACSCGAQAPPNDSAANESGPSTLPAQTQANGPGPAISPAPGQPASGQTAPGQQVDPPARVARLANMSGNVSFTPAGEHDWVQAQLNRPIVTGDKLWTADGARAELQVGSSTVRLDYQSNFDFLNLNDQIAQMQLTHGTLNLDVWRLRNDETYEVDTPTIAFIANRVGDYRIDVDSQGGFTTVTARRGGGEAVGEGGKRVTIEEGQSIRFNDSGLKDYQVNVSSPDDFDRYCSARKERHVSAPARNYVSENVVGYEDLDEYGTWESAPQYGHVWYPTAVAVDWAPYRAGHWVWIDPWGWNWVDDAPWGFAPFHYGRWAYVGTRWGWVPGPVDIAPVYAPALVAFVGGGGFGVSVSVGGPIGWFALGPGDAYFPGYYGGHDYFNRVNAGYVNQTVINNYYGAWSSGNVNYSQMTFANRDAPRALTAVPTAAFASGRPVATSAVAVNRTTMANARVLPRAMVTPTQTSVVAGQGRAAAPPAAVTNRAVVAAHTPPPATPSFAQRQAVLQKNAGQPLSTNQMRTLAAQPNGRGANATATNNVRVVGNRGGAAASSTALQAPGDTAQAANSGNARGPQQSPNGRNADRTAANGNAAESRVRSADFAHPGGAQNNAPRTSNAQPGRAEANNLPSTRNNDNRGRQVTDMARRAESGNPTAVATPNARNAQVRNNESVRGNASTTRSTNRVAPETGPAITQRSESASRSRGSINAQNSHSTAATARGNTRASGPSFTNAPTQASKQSRGSAHVQQSAPVTRPTYSLRERGAPAQHSAPQRAPAQAMAQHAPPPQQRAPAPQQRQKAVARQAPQNAPHGNEKKKDGGG
jgi:hypothetical protein